MSDRGPLKQRHLTALGDLPAGAALAITVDLGAALAWAANDGLGLMPTRDGAPIRDALGALSIAELGLDLTRATLATAWFAPATRAFAIWIQGDFGANPLLRTRRASLADVDGTPAVTLGGGLYLASLGGRVVVANREGLTLSHWPGQTLQADYTTRRLHERALEPVGDGAIIGTAALSQGVGAKDVARALAWLTGLSPTSLSLDAVAISVTPALRVELVATGDRSGREAAADVIRRQAPRWLQRARAAFADEKSPAGTPWLQQRLGQLVDRVASTSALVDGESHLLLSAGPIDPSGFAEGALAAFAAEARALAAEATGVRREVAP